MDVLDNDLKNADNGAWAYAQKWALYGVAISIILGLVGFLTTTPDYSSLEAIQEMQSSPMNLAIQWIGYILFIGAIVMATRERAADFGNGFSFGKAWTTGTVTAVVFAVLLGLWVIIYMTFIDTGVVEGTKIAMEAAWEEQGMSDEQIEQAASWAGMFTSPVAIGIMAAIMYVIGGMIVSIISAAIFKNE